jgi:hypothetical protein
MHVHDSFGQRTIDPSDHTVDLAGCVPKPRPESHAPDVPDDSIRGLLDLLTSADTARSVEASVERIWNDYKTKVTVKVGGSRTIG